MQSKAAKWRKLNYQDKAIKQHGEVKNYTVQGILPPLPPGCLCRGQILGNFKEILDCRKWPALKV